MKNYPVVRIILSFICGIILQQYITFGLFLFTVIYLITLILYFIIPFTATLSRKLLFFLLITTMFTLAGNLSADICFTSRQFYSAKIEKENSFTVYGTIESIYLINKKGLKFELITDSAYVNKILLKRQVVLICNVIDENTAKMDSLYSIVAPGNKICAEGTFIKGRTCRNPGEFDYNNYLHLYGTTGLLNVYNSDDFKILNNSKDWFPDILFHVRKSIAEKLSRYHDFQAASLMKGLLLADRSEMDDDTKTEFVNAGVVHVLAVSGLNVEYILLLCVILLGRLNIYPKSFLTILFLIFFLLITGMQASVFRAVLMSAIMIIGFLSSRSTGVINSIALSAFILLIFFPFYLYDPGFQLSYAAVFSMGIIYPLFYKELKNIKNSSIKMLTQLVTLSLSAQIGTIPFTLYYFGKLSLTSLVANLIVIPYIGILVGIGIASLLFSYIFPYIALCYGSINSLLTRLLYLIVHISGNENYSFIRIRNYSLFDGIVFYLLLIASIYLFERFTHSTARLFLICLIFANYLVISALANKALLTKNEFNVIMIDVGQGDSFLLRFPNGETALVDAGQASMKFDNGKQIILPLINYLDIPVIDYAFISHIDSDHYSGFVSLIQAGKIKKIYKPQLDTSLSRDIKFENFIRENKIPLTYYSNSEIKIGNTRIFILNNKYMHFRKTNSNNDNSSLLKVIYGKTSFLFTGDLGKTAEKY
ncbi:MAG: DNA internalization-related competence protein ComEC/Rec2 [Ignavibacteriaceae bacterium]|nr:DNA internalization-related competence protein ComEC/Rec2 [Ignavibacteriaceae bacterium]